MILDVVKYGHPALRKKGDKIAAVTPEIRKLAADMLETMHEAKGIGLAAQQIGRAMQLMVIDIRCVTDRPSTLELKGKPADVAKFMPLVLINPELAPSGKPATGPEGCLSFPEIFADITRPESVGVSALNEKGERIEFHCGGLLARVVQHETDHLHGILFIDRMSRETKEKLKPELDTMLADTKAELKKESKRGAA
jgi:peptide deformylase